MRLLHFRHSFLSRKEPPHGPMGEVGFCPSYVGLVPSEESSGDRRRLGHISRQGNSPLRFFLVEAAQITVRSQPQRRSKFFHLALRRGRKIVQRPNARASILLETGGNDSGWSRGRSG